MKRSVLRRALVGLVGSVLPLAVLTSAATAAPTVATCFSMKPYLTGNVSRQFEAISGRNAAHASLVQGVVINLTWRELEPRPGQFAFGTLDSQLAYA